MKLVDRAGSRTGRWDRDRYSARRRARQASRPDRLSLEQLEIRELLAFVVGPNVNVSNLAGDQSEVTIALNPANPLNLIAGANDIGGAAGADPTWYSNDNGSTWTLSTIPVPAGNTGGGDPTIAFNRAGSAVYAHLCTNGICTARSLNGGQTWTATRIPGTQAGDDKEFLSVGPDRNNLNQDRFYLGFQRGGVQFVTSSVDGLTWNAPVRISDPGNDGINTQIAVDRNGVVYAAWQEFGAAGFGEVSSDRSFDGGLTWGADVVASTTNVTPFANPGTYNIPAAPTRGVGAFLSIDVDRSGGLFDGQLYMTVVDQGDLDGNPDTGNPADFNDLDVFVIRSADGGQTWSGKVRVNDDTTITSQFLPWLDVDDANGFVSVAWYDARNDVANNERVGFFLTTSFDGALSFDTNVQVSTGLTNQGNSNPLRDFNNYGEYPGLAVFNNVAHPVWADNSVTARLDVFTAAVTIVPPGALYGIETLGNGDSRVVEIDRITGQILASCGPLNTLCPPQGGIELQGTAVDANQVAWGFEPGVGLYTIDINPDDPANPGNPNPAFGRYTFRFGSTLDIRGLAINPQNRQMFGITGAGALFRVNQFTGQTTFVGQDPQLATAGIEGMAFDAQGNLFATGIAGSGTSQLYRIDPGTGGATPVGGAAIAFDAVVGMDLVFGAMYASDDAGDSLVTLDLSAGTASLVGPFNSPLGHPSIFFGSGVPVAGDRFEPNNTPALATDLGQVICACEPQLSIHAAGEEDWFKVAAAVDGLLGFTINFQNSQGNLDLFVSRDADGDGVPDTAVGQSQTANNTEIVGPVAVTAGATFWVQVVGVGGATNPQYELKVSNEDRFSAAQGLSVGPNVNVSSAPGDQAEVTIAINPTDPLNLIASSNDLSGPAQDPTWFSRDGGLTWTLSPIPNVPGTAPLGDPTLAFDRLGNAYFAHLDGGSISVARSTDGGQTWTAVQVPTPAGFVDKEFFGVGPDVNNLAQDRLYIAYHVGNVQFINSSTDGITWSPAVRVQDAGAGINAQVGVAGDGTVYMSWQEIGATPGVSRIFFDVSRDGGLTWGTDLVAYTSNVNPFNDPGSPCGGQYCVPAAPQRGMAAYLAIDVDRSGGPFDGRVYLSIVDQGDLDGNPDAGNPQDHDDTDVFVVYTDDEGQTWTPPIRVNDDTTNNSQLVPWLAVDQTTGNVGLVWYDTRNDPANEQTEFFFGLSTDGGNTFTNVLVSEGQSDESLSNPVGSFFDYGEYTGLAFLGGVAHAAWADNSGLLGTSPGNQDLFTAAISTGGSLTSNDTAATATDFGRTVHVLQSDLTISCADEDWYQAEIPADRGSIAIELRLRDLNSNGVLDASERLRAELYDATGTQLLASSRLDGFEVRIGPYAVDLNDVVLVRVLGEPYVDSLHGNTSGANQYQLDLVVNDRFEFGPLLQAVTTADDASAVVDLGFDFHFQGQTFDQITVSSNGFVVLGATTPAIANDPTPDVAVDFLSGPPRIAPFWTDFDPSSNGRVHFQAFQQGTQGRALVTWVGVESGDSALSPLLRDSHTFQLELFDDGATGTIVFRYDGATLPALFNDQILVGFTPGGGATDPGPTNFQAAAVTPQPLNPGEPSLYELFDPGTLDFDLDGLTFSFAPDPALPTGWLVSRSGGGVTDSLNNDARQPARLGTVVDTLELDLTVPDVDEDWFEFNTLAASSLVNSAAIDVRLAVPDIDASGTVEPDEQVSVEVYDPRFSTTIPIAQGAFDPVRSVVEILDLPADRNQTFLVRVTGTLAVTATANVNVNAAPGNQSNSDVAINPTNPQNRVAVSNDGADPSRIFVSTSNNGGTTWVRTQLDENVDGLGANDRRSDPHVRFDSDGSLYITYSVSSPTGSNIVLAYLPAGAGPNVATETEPNSDGVRQNFLMTAADAAAANDLSSDFGPVGGQFESTVTGTLEVGGEDVFSFLARPGGQVTIATESFNASFWDSLIELYDSNLNLLTFDDNGQGVFAGFSRLTFNIPNGVPANSVFYVKVRGFGAADGGDYRLRTTTSYPQGSFFNFSVIATNNTSNSLVTPNLATRDDPTGPDDVLVVWSLQGPTGDTIRAALSTDGAVTFPITNLAVNDALLADGRFPSAAADANGNFIVVWEEDLGGFPFPQGRISSDRLDGTSLADSVDRLVTQTNVTGFFQIPAQPDRGIWSLPTVAVDLSGGSFNGRAYVSFTNSLGGGIADTNIFVTSSDNGGGSWSAPVRVNDDTGGASQFLPRLGVDRTNGAVHVAWYDARRDLANRRTDVFYATSLSGAGSFGANSRVNAASYNQSTTNNVRDQVNNFGDYIGLSAFGGNASLTWSGNPVQPANLDVFTTRVTPVVGSNAFGVAVRNLDQYENLDLDLCTDDPFDPNDPFNPNDPHCRSVVYTENFEPVGATGQLLAGPDAFGYLAFDAPFAFQDISPTGTRLLANSDDLAVVVPIGFDFDFYGITYTDLVVSPNGLITFPAVPPFTHPFNNTNLAAGGGPTDPLIAPLWDDLLTNATTPPISLTDGVYYENSVVGGSQVLTIQWNNVTAFGGTSPGTFQVQLFDSGDVIFQYPDVTFGTPTTNNGASATVGIRAGAPAGGNRLPVSFNQSVIADQSAIRITLGGGQAYTIDNTGGSTPGLWHTTNRRAFDPGHSSRTSFYYGQDSVGHYDTGNDNAGRITSPPIDLTGLDPGAPAVLTFNYFIATEPGFGHFNPIAQQLFDDVAELQVSSDGFQTFVTLASNQFGGANTLIDSTSIWQTLTLDVDQFLGQVIQLRFDFSTGDDGFNNFEGWYIDDVTVTATVEDNDAAVRANDLSDPDGDGVLNPISGRIRRDALTVTRRVDPFANTLIREDGDWFFFNSEKGEVDVRLDLTDLNGNGQIDPNESLILELYDRTGTTLLGTATNSGLAGDLSVQISGIQAENNQRFLVHVVGATPASFNAFDLELFTDDRLEFVDTFSGLYAAANTDATAAPPQRLVRVDLGNGLTEGCETETIPCPLDVLANGRVTDIDYSSSGVLIGVTDTRRVVTINPRDGVESNVRPIVNIGTETPTAVEFDDLRGQVYLATARPGATSRLYRIDLSGVVNVPATLIADTGVGEIGGLAVASDGTVYGVAGGPNASGTLYQLSNAAGVVTGIAAPVGPTGFQDVAGLEFSLDSLTLYGALGSFETIGQPGQLIEIVPGTGSAFLIAPPDAGLNGGGFLGVSFRPPLQRNDDDETASNLGTVFDRVLSNLTIDDDLDDATPTIEPDEDMFSARLPARRGSPTGSLGTFSVILTRSDSNQDGVFDPSEDLNFEVLDEQLNVIAACGTPAQDPNDPFRLSIIDCVQTVDEQQIFVRVFGPTGSRNSYSLRVSANDRFDLPGAGAAADAFEPPTLVDPVGRNDAPAAAADLGALVGTFLTDLVRPDGDQDWFRLQTRVDGSVDATLLLRDLDLDGVLDGTEFLAARLYDATGTVLLGTSTIDAATFQARLSDLRATRTIALAGPNNDLVFTAVTPGTAGSNISVEYRQPAGGPSALSLTVTGSSIVVNLATNFFGQVTTTARGLRDFIETNGSAGAVATRALVTASLAAGDNGSGLLGAVAPTPLQGPTAGTTYLLQVIGTGGTASATTNLPLAGDDLVFRAVNPGAAGEQISIEYRQPAGSSSPLSVQVTGNAIVVNLATNALGNLTTTALQIRDFIQTSNTAGAVAARALVDVALAPGTTGGNLVAPLGPLYLAGQGTNGYSLLLENQDRFEANDSAADPQDFGPLLHVDADTLSIPRFDDDWYQVEARAENGFLTIRVDIADLNNNTALDASERIGLELYDAANPAVPLPAFVAVDNVAAAVDGTPFGVSIDNFPAQAGQRFLVRVFSTAVQAGPKGTMLYAARPSTGDIVAYSPSTGQVLLQFKPPAGAEISARDTEIGLAVGDNGRTLYYINNHSNPTTVFGLDPNTGRVLSTTPINDFRGSSGLGFDAGRVFANDEHLDVHRITPGSGANEFFVAGSRNYVNAVGGDDQGREFVVCIEADRNANGQVDLVEDCNANGSFDANPQFLVEFDPNGAGVVNVLSVPAAVPTIHGLAFDGRTLFATDGQGRVYSIDPDSGSLQGSVVALGALDAVYALAAFLPQRSAEYSIDLVNDDRFDQVRPAFFAFDRQFGQVVKIEIVEDPLGGSIDVGRVTRLPATGLPALHGLAFDPTTQTLFGLDANADQLYVVNLVTGVATRDLDGDGVDDLGPLGLDASFALVRDSTTDTLYTVTNLGALVKISSSTGQGILLGPNNPTMEGVAGLAFDAGLNRLVAWDNIGGPQLFQISLTPGATFGQATELLPTPMQGSIFDLTFDGSQYIVGPGSNFNELFVVTAGGLTDDPARLPDAATPLRLSNASGVVERVEIDALEYVRDNDAREQAANLGTIVNRLQQRLTLPTLSPTTVDEDWYRFEASVDGLLNIELRIQDDDGDLVRDPDEALALELFRASNPAVPFQCITLPSSPFVCRITEFQPVAKGEVFQARVFALNPGAQNEYNLVIVNQDRFDTEVIPAILFAVVDDAANPLVGGDRLVTLDTTGAVAPNLAGNVSLGAFGAVSDLAFFFDPTAFDTQLVYGVTDTGNLMSLQVTIDANTFLVTVGPETLVGPAGLAGARYTALAFDPTATTLFGAITNGTQSSLVTIDRLTGAAQVVGATGLNTLGGLAFSPTGQLFATEVGGAVYELDPATATVIRPVGPTGFNDVSALRFTEATPAGATTLFGGLGIAETVAAPGTPGQLATISLANGAGTPLSPAPFAAITGLAFSPRLLGDDSPGRANVLGPIVRQAEPDLTITAGDQDWFGFTSQAIAGFVNARLQVFDRDGTGLIEEREQLEVRLYRASDPMTPLATSVTSTTTALAEILNVAAQPGEQFLVQIRSAISATGIAGINRYNLELFNNDRFDPAASLPQNDDATRATDFGFLFQQTLNSLTVPGDDQDWFRFRTTAAAGSVQTVATVQAGGGSITVRICDGDCNDPARVLASGSGTTVNINAPAGKAQTILVQVLSTSSVTPADALYDLRIFNHDRYDAPGGFLNETPATPTDLGGVVFLDQSDLTLTEGDQDWYRVTGRANNGSYRVRIMSQDTTPLFAEFVDQANVAGPIQSGTDFTITHAANAGELLRLHVYRSVTFDRAVSFGTAAGAEAVVAGDFNNDGRIDLVVANFDSDNISFLRGLGGGVFQDPVNFPVDDQPESVAAGDVNGDGQLDVVVANSGATATAVTLLLGTGDGAFQPGVAVPVGLNANDVALADLNNDSRLDIAAVSRTAGANNVAVALGNGNATFQAATFLTAGTSAESVAAGDVNGDGRRDLVVANRGTSNGSVSVFLGNGNGTFQPAASFATGAGTADVVLGDFNGDTRLDLATANSIAGTVSVLLGNGNGTFQAAQNFFTAAGPAALAVADLNGDGRLDIAAAASAADTASVLLGNGNGSFQVASNQDVGVTPSAIAIADLDGDAHLDLVSANQLSNNVSVVLNANSAVLYNLTIENDDAFDAPTGDLNDSLATATARGAVIYERIDRLTVSPRDEDWFQLQALAASGSYRVHVTSNASPAISAQLVAADGTVLNSPPDGTDFSFNAPATTGDTRYVRVLATAGAEYSIEFFNDDRDDSPGGDRNETLGTATALGSVVRLRRDDQTITAGDDDFYAIQAAGAATSFEVRVRPTDTDLNGSLNGNELLGLRLLDAAGNVLASTSTAGGCGDLLEICLTGPVAPGDPVQGQRRIQVFQPAASSINTYDIVITNDLAADVFDLSVGNNTAAQASNLGAIADTTVSGLTVTAAPGGSGDEDWYRIQTTAIGGNLTVVLRLDDIVGDQRRDPEETLTLALFDNTGTQLLQAGALASPSTSNFEVRIDQFPADRDQVFLVRVNGGGTALNSYSLRFRTDDQFDPNAQAERNNTANDAVDFGTVVDELRPALTISQGDEDWFLVRTRAGDGGTVSVRVDLRDLNGNANLDPNELLEISLFDPASPTIALPVTVVTDATAPGFSRSILNVPALRDQAFLVRVHSDQGGVNAYDLNIASDDRFDTTQTGNDSAASATNLDSPAGTLVQTLQQQLTVTRGDDDWFSFHAAAEIGNVTVIVQLGDTDGVAGASAAERVSLELVNAIGQVFTATVDASNPYRLGVNAPAARGELIRAHVFSGASVSFNEYALELFNDDQFDPAAGARNDSAAAATNLGQVVHTVTADLTLPVRAASLVTQLAGANNDVAFSAVTPGPTGNAISIRYVDPAGPNRPISVNVNGSAITVSLQTDGSGQVISRAVDVRDAVNTTPAAAALVRAAVATGEDGSGLVTPMTAAQSLAGAIDQDWFRATTGTDSGYLSVAISLVNRDGVAGLSAPELLELELYDAGNATTALARGVFDGQGTVRIVNRPAAANSSFLIRVLSSGGAFNAYTLDVRNEDRFDPDALTGTRNDGDTNSDNVPDLFVNRGAAVRVLEPGLSVVRADQDVFRVVAPVDGSLAASLANLRDLNGNSLADTAEGLLLSVLDASGAVLATSGPVANFAVTLPEVVVAGGQVLFVRVAGLTATSANQYDLDVRFDDVLDGTAAGTLPGVLDPGGRNDSALTASALSRIVSPAVSNLTIAGADEDWFLVQRIGTDGRIDVSMTVDDVDQDGVVDASETLSVELHGANGLPLVPAVIATAPEPGTFTSRLQYFVAGDPSTDFFLRVSGGSGAASNRYRLSVENVDEFDRAGSNESLSSATNLGGRVDFNESNLTVTPGDNDFYRMAIPGPGILRVGASFTNATGDLNVELLSAAGTVIGQRTVEVGSEQITFTVPGATEVFVHVSGANATVANEYALNIVLTDPIDATTRNDNLDTATDLGSVVQTSLTNLTVSTGDADYFRVEPIAQSGALRVVVRQGDPNGNGLLDASESLDLVINDVGGIVCSTTSSTCPVVRSGFDIRVDRLTVEGGQPIFVQVQGLTIGTNVYTLDVVNLDQFDAVANNDTFATATDLMRTGSPGATGLTIVSGTQSDQDFLKFTAPNNGTLDVRVRISDLNQNGGLDAAESLRLEVTTPRGTTPGVLRANRGEVQVVNLPVNANETIVLHVFGTSATPVSVYDLSATVNDLFEAGLGNDSPATASNLGRADAATGTGLVVAPNDDDWYSVQVANAGIVTVNLNGLSESGGAVGVEVYDSRGTVLRDASIPRNGSQRLDVLATKGERLLVRVFSPAGQTSGNDYSLQFVNAVNLSGGRLEVRPGPGNDNVQIADLKNVTINGTLYNSRVFDRLFGSAAPVNNYVVASGRGNDNIQVTSLVSIPGKFRMGGGNDTVVAGSGNDSIVAGAGNDTIDGGSGLDTIKGGAGNDLLLGGSGADIIAGDVGDDAIDGGSGNDIIAGGDGNDAISGGDGAESICGGAGNDFIDGGFGNDSIAGASGLDQLFGRDGFDLFFLLAGDVPDSIDAGLDGGANVSGGSAFCNSVELQTQ